MNVLEPITVSLPQPLNYRERTQHHLPSHKSKLQKTLSDIDKFCSIQQMQVNVSKSTTTVFNTSKNKDFAPALTNDKGHLYQYTESFKLLGVNFQTDPIKGLSWETYINNKIKCAYANMWLLRRLSEMGVSQQKLLLIFKSKVRVHVEMNIPLWTFSINKKLSNKIEYIYLVEGYMDVIGLRSKGIDNVVANLGTSLTERQVSVLNQFYNDLIIC